LEACDVDDCKHKARGVYRLDLAGARASCRDRSSKNTDRDEIREFMLC
jgi:hypothetical protein